MGNVLRREKKAERDQGKKGAGLAVGKPFSFRGLCFRITRELEETAQFQKRFGCVVWGGCCGGCVSLSGRLSASLREDGKRKMREGRR